MDSHDEYERYLKDQLSDLQHEYHERAKPIIDQLIRIHDLRPTKQIIVNTDLSCLNGADHLLVEMIREMQRKS